jgi:hypothetical protein
MTIGNMKIALAAAFVLSSMTMASAQYLYAPRAYQDAWTHNIPTEQQHWYDRNAVGQNV